MTILRDKDHHQGKGDGNISPMPRPECNFEGGQARASCGSNFTSSSDTEHHHLNDTLEDTSKNHAGKNRVPYAHGIDVELSCDNESRCMSSEHDKGSKVIFDFLFTNCDDEHLDSEDDSICITRNRLARRRSSLDHCRQYSENITETELKGRPAE